jgi:hypothetical protein
MNVMVGGGIGPQAGLGQSGLPFARRQVKEERPSFLKKRSKKLLQLAFDVSIK